MIRDIAELADGTALQSEVGIVGAGFAGIELARYLGRHGVRVVLLESGRSDFDPETQRLARVDSVGKPLRTPDPDGGFTPYLPPIFRGETRLRQFGGTSNIWTGKWKIFDSLDFAKRPWIPHSGWPFGLEELRPFYDEVARDYGLEDFDAFARGAANETRRKALGEAGLKVSFHFWEKETIRPVKRFFQELQQAATVNVVLGANATEIVLDDDLERVRSMTFQSLDGRRLTLAASYFVLATGGLEVARLLLASDRQAAAGIGNRHGMVGRFFMDHPKHKRGTLRPGRAVNLITEQTATRPRPGFKASFSLSDDVQQRQALLNHAIYFTPVYKYQIGYPVDRVSAIKAALRTAKPWRALAPTMALLKSPSVLWKTLQMRLHQNRGGPIAHYSVAMYMEQAPNPASRLYLGSECDALGTPRLVVDWQLTPFDQEVFQKVLRGLADAFAEAGIGTLDFGAEPFTLDDTVDAAHHIGATRMAATPAEGVVDRHCRVFDTENLFVASSSVFPTGHSVAPTFTIIALARRLGVHLLKLRATPNVQAAEFASH